MVRSLILIALSLTSFACNRPDKFDEATARHEIMLLHNQQRKYHFEKMAEAFISQFSENFISVDKGEITTPTTEESLNKFKNYFDSVKFLKWDDIAPPVIRFSDDGTMAYEVVNKKVVISYKDDKNKRVKETTVFAWLTIYRRYGNNWKIDCIASTNQQPIYEDM